MTSYENKIKPNILANNFFSIYSGGFYMNKILPINKNAAKS